MTDTIPDQGGASLDYRPLYLQVRETLVQRIASGEWPAGSVLPSEHVLAAEMQVSQGTVRKALDAMRADNLLVRRQGRGTFVARHGEGPILFQFFKLLPDHGTHVFPDSRVSACAKVLACDETRRQLDLPRKAEVVHISRVRWLDAGPCIAEQLWVPAALFPGLETLELPNNLYAFYAKQFAVTISGGHERLKAVTLAALDAQRLNTTPGTPALQIDRVATALDGRPAEWRVSLCLTEGMHYLTTLK